MSSNIAKDLYEAYLNEMEPQLGKKKEEGGSEGGGGASSPDEAAAKRIRQAVYDIRYRARREDIDVSQAYSQYMSNTSMAANEKSAVRDKLGLGTGGQAGGQAEEVEHVDEVYKGKHGQSDKEYADSRSQGGKMVSGDSKRSGAEYTHGRRVKAENPGMQPDVGGKTKPKSQGKMDAGGREDMMYRKKNLERKHRIAKISTEEVEQVDEYAKPGERYLRVKPKRGTHEKEYVKKYDPNNPNHRLKAARLRAKGFSATQTSYGVPYDQDFSSNAGEKHEKKYGPANGKNTVGDRDGDGTKEPDRHEYAGVKDKAIKKAIAKKASTKKLAKQPPAKKAKKATRKESFSNWREEIREVVEKANAIREKDKQIKEKAVNNTINVNPDIPIKELADNLGAELVESVDLGEDFEEMIADYATEYFFAEGLNENGIDILIEDIGVDDFVDYVLDLFEEFEEEVLSEARAGGAKIEPTTKTGKSVGSLKGGAKAAAIKRLRGEKAKRSEAEASASAEKPSGMTAALKKQSEKAKVTKGLKKASTEKKVEKAKASQAPAANKSSEGTKKEVKKGILGAIRNARAVGKKYEKKADKLRDKVGAAAGTAAGAAVGAAKVVHRAGQEAGRSEAGKKVKATLAKAGKAAVAGAAAGAKKGETNTAAGRAGRAVGTFLRKMKEDYELWIEELVDEGYDVWEYDELYLIETYLPEDLDEGLGSALKGMITKASDKMKQSEMDSARKRLEKRRAERTAQRKTPSTPIRKPNTSARDPWSGNPDTDKAWKQGRNSSTPHAYKGTHEEFEEWMEAVLAEGLDIDENMLFLIYESSFAEEILVEKAGLYANIHAKRARGERPAKPGDEDYPDKDAFKKAAKTAKEEVEVQEAKKGSMKQARKNVGASTCWDGYEAKGTKKKNGKVVPNCVKNEDTKLENVISQIRDKKKLETVDERTRYAKETGKDPQTGNPSVKGGEKQDPAFAQVSRELRKTGGMMSSRRKPIQPQGKKKVPGAKPPKGITPVDRIRGKLAKKRAPKPDIGSRFD